MNNEGTSTISNEGEAPGTPLGSVSNGTELELVKEAPREIASLSGGKGADTGPGMSGPRLLVRGTERLARSPRPRSLDESLIGPDERVRILDTEAAPWRMISSLFIRGRSGAVLGTGWFAGPRTIITAGHCVYHPQIGGWATEITITPARDARRTPFGEPHSKSFSTTNRWFQEQNADFDYAAIHLGPEAEEITSKTGWFATTVLNDAGLLDQQVNVSGYPGDKGINELQGTEQWFHAKQIVHVAPQRIYYDVDTMGGQSGAPAWLDTNEGPKAVGIHAYGVGGASSVGLEANSAPRITEAVLGVLKGWIEKR